MPALRCFTKKAHWAPKHCFWVPTTLSRAVAVTAAAAGVVENLLMTPPTGHARLKWLAFVDTVWPHD